MVYLLFMIAMACPPTQVQPRDESCRVLCVRDGFMIGNQYKKGCACTEIKDSYEDFITRTINIGEMKTEEVKPEVKPRII